MKCYVYTPGLSSESVTLKEKSVAPGSRLQKRALLGENIERAVTMVASATHAPRWFVENIIRWRARKGMVLVAAVK